MTQRRVKPAAVLTLIGAIVLVGSEILAAAAAAAWALAGIAGLGTNGFYALAAVLCGLALYATYAFARQAIKSEPIYGNI